MTEQEAMRLWRICADQLEIDRAAEEVRLHQLGNGEFVVKLVRTEDDWILWSHRDWKDLRHIQKAMAARKRVSPSGQPKRRSKQQGGTLEADLAYT